MEILSLSPSSAAFAELSEELLHLGKSLRFQARGASMRPLVRDGDMLLVEPANLHQIHIGDIVLFRHQPGKILVHRVIRKRLDKQGTSFLIQGDQAAQADGWMPQECLFGRLSAVERDGNHFFMGSMRMRILSCFAVLRSRWHLDNNKMSNRVVHFIKKMPIFSIFTS
jgi:hypothetical protein